jgi:hypothetical protein
MADNVHAEQKHEHAGAGFGGSFTGGHNPYTTGDLEINDVSPLDGEGGPVGKPGRTTGETGNAETQDAVSRMLASSPDQIEGRAAADTSEPEPR